MKIPVQCEKLQLLSILLNYNYYHYCYFHFFNVSVTFFFISFYNSFFVFILSFSFLFFNPSLAPFKKILGFFNFGVFLLLTFSFLGWQGREKYNIVTLGRYVQHFSQVQVDQQVLLGLLFVQRFAFMAFQNACDKLSGRRCE